MNDAEKALEEAKRQLAQRSGVLPCASVGCLRVARVRVFWPVLPGEDWPVYCGPCAARACAVLEALWCKPRFEVLPKPPDPEPARQVTPGGFR